MEPETTTEIEAAAFTINELKRIIADNSRDGEADVDWFLAIWQAKQCSENTLKDTARMFQYGIPKISSHRQAYFAEFVESSVWLAGETGESFGSIVLSAIYQYVGKGEG
jgi:hypothetical protein